MEAVGWFLRDTLLIMLQPLFVTHFSDFRAKVKVTVYRLTSQGMNLCILPFPLTFYLLALIWESSVTSCLASSLAFTEIQQPSRKPAPRGRGGMHDPAWGQGEIQWTAKLDAAVSQDLSDAKKMFRGITARAWMLKEVESVLASALVPRSPFWPAQNHIPS